MESSVMFDIVMETTASVATYQGIECYITKFILMTDKADANISKLKAYIQLTN